MKIWHGVALAAVCALVWAGWGLRRAQSELGRSRADIDSAARLAVERSRWTPPAHQFEPAPAAPRFVDAALFNGGLWLAGGAGLFRYSPQGELLRSWLVGTDLPQARPTRLAVGLDPVSQRQALFVATAGAGLLVVNAAGDVDRILPADPGLHNLTALLPRASGEVVLGSLHAGVAAYTAGGLRRLDEALNAVRVTALAGDEGDLWVGAAGEGLLRWTGGRLERLSRTELLPDEHVTALTGDAERLYAGTPAGVAEIVSGRVRRVLADGFFAQSLLLHGERLLLGSLDEGLMEILLTSGPSPDGAPEGPGAVIRLLASGSTALAVTPDAVYHREPGAGWEKLFSAEAGLSDRNISALHAADDGNLWVGFFDRGLDIVDPAGGVRHHESDRVFCVNRIVADPARYRVAVATANGLTFFDPAGVQRETWTRADGLISDHVADIAVRPEGLVAGTAAGLTFLEPGGPRSLYAFHGLVNNHVYAVASRGRRLLAGTLGGLSVIEGGAVTHSHTTANSNLRHNWINAIAELGGDWYVGTYGAGVARLDATGAWTLFPDMQGVEINPGAMTIGDKGLYAGTLDRGLLIFDPERQTWRTVAEGLPSANVTAVEAKAGMLWVGTDNGLVKIAEEALLWP